VLNGGHKFPLHTHEGPIRYDIQTIDRGHEELRVHSPDSAPPKLSRHQFRHSFVGKTEKNRLLHGKIVGDGPKKYVRQARNIIRVWGDDGFVTDRGTKLLNPKFLPFSHAEQFQESWLKGVLHRLGKMMQHDRGRIYRWCYQISIWWRCCCC